MSFSTANMFAERIGRGEEDAHRAEDPLRVTRTQHSGSDTRSWCCSLATRSNEAVLGTRWAPPSSSITSRSPATPSTTLPAREDGDRLRSRVDGQLVRAAASLAVERALGQVM
jgi:hypothetical protein